MYVTNGWSICGIWGGRLSFEEFEAELVLRNAFIGNEVMRRGPRPSVEEFDGRGIWAVLEDGGYLK